MEHINACLEEFVVDEDEEDEDEVTPEFHPDEEVTEVDEEKDFLR
jgi:hypothetical protein